jgi:hypothetical protein
MEGQHHRRPVSDGMSEPGNKRQRIHVAEDIRPHHSPYNALNRVVRLNVGGHKYMTTTATLIKVKGSRFEAMFAPGASSPLRDDEGTYFIDRDGTLFPLFSTFCVTAASSCPLKGRCCVLCCERRSITSFHASSARSSSRWGRASRQQLSLPVT